MPNLDSLKVQKHNRFAFHIFGDRINEFASCTFMPKTLLYNHDETIPISVKGDICIHYPYKSENIIDAAVGVHYSDNYDQPPNDSRYVIFYGDIRDFRQDRRIPVVCDIMDENFWYYWKILRNFGLFTFSVNSTLCDISVYQKTITNLKSIAKPIKYTQLSRNKS